MKKTLALIILFVCGFLVVSIGVSGTAFLFHLVLGHAITEVINPAARSILIIGCLVGGMLFLELMIRACERFFYK